MGPRFMRSHVHYNIHPYERVVRVIVGAVLLMMTFSSHGLRPWFLLGAIPLITGLVGYCPLYFILGINTNRLSKVHLARTREVPQVPEPPKSS